MRGTFAQDVRARARNCGPHHLRVDLNGLTFTPSVAHRFCDCGKCVLLEIVSLSFVLLQYFHFSATFEDLQNEVRVKLIWGLGYSDEVLARHVLGLKYGCTEFDNLLSRAAEVPRTFGLALPESSKDVRKQFFDSMENQNIE